ncbi:MAG: hypothetical protein ACYC6Y_15420 [Thermoguttaceae bacterium]
MAYWSVRTVNGLCTLFLMLSVATRYFNRPSRIQQHFAALSYRIYLLHMAVVFLVQFMFWNLPGLPTAAVLMGTIVVSLAASYAIAVALNGPAAWYAAWIRGRAVGITADGRPPFSAAVVHGAAGVEAPHASALAARQTTAADENAAG